MKFNHESEKITESFNITMDSSDMAEKVTQIVKNWVVSPDSDKVSVLGEMLHNELPYEVILFLATQEVYGKVKSTMSEMTTVLSKLLKEVDKAIDEQKAKLN